MPSGSSISAMVASQISVGLWGGIDEAMAKNAVHLQVPPGAGLIRAEDRTVLAAIASADPPEVLR